MFHFKFKYLLVGIVGDIKKKKSITTTVCVYVKLHTVLSTQIASLSCSKPDDLKYEAMAKSKQSVMYFKSLEGWKKRKLRTA